MIGGVYRLTPIFPRPADIEDISKQAFMQRNVDGAQHVIGLYPLIRVYC